MSTPTLSSTPILRTALVWSAIVTAVLAIVGGIAGYLIDGTSGLWSALVGVCVTAIFLSITAVSILIANRWFGDPLYVQIFFGIVLGGWILKLIVFIVAMLLLRGQSWVNPTIFFVAIVASVLASLVVDTIVMLKMRVPVVSESVLPSEVTEDRGLDRRQ